MTNPRLDWHAAIIDAVRRRTHSRAEARAAPLHTSSREQVVTHQTYDEARAAPLHTSSREQVRRVTHIAPADPDGTIIGEPVLQEGVIGIPSHSHATPTPLPRHSHDMAHGSRRARAGVTDAPFATTTEVCCHRLSQRQTR